MIQRPCYKYHPFRYGFGYDRNEAVMVYTSIIYYYFLLSWVQHIVERKFVGGRYLILARLILHIVHHLCRLRLHLLISLLKLTLLDRNGSGIALHCYLTALFKED